MKRLTRFCRVYITMLHFTSFYLRSKYHANQTYLKVIFGLKQENSVENRQLTVFSGFQFQCSTSRLERHLQLTTSCTYHISKKSVETSVLYNTYIQLFKRIPKTCSRVRISAHVTLPSPIITKLTIILFWFCNGKLLANSKESHTKDDDDSMAVAKQKNINNITTKI